MHRRAQRIFEIIARTPIATQEELVRALRARGIRVTQATVSRDIKRLGLVKVPTGDGSYRYAAPGATPPPGEEVRRRLQRAFADYVTAVEEGSGLVLVKTADGSAGPVAEAIDDAAWPEVAGTVAGDNTIIVVPRLARHRAVVLRRLRSLL
ncbi:MAG: arginine repressor [Armatimonadota bacterium]|nr:arginine repressor [Armatimonadota bacterium]MDR7533322.1 arginine repressor [Armatimonadota bacterium]MDR7536559.1 arginine repressor [Armatimonadota bacterium]